MAGICTAVTSPHNCGHKTVTVTIDGVAVDLHEYDGDPSDPLTAEEIALFVRLGAKRLRARGVSWSQMLRRVTNGDEATNVKQYDFIGPGAAVTKTNIGTSYVNVLPGANGERILADLSGCTEFRVVLTANLVGSGQWGARVIQDGDAAVLFEVANLGAGGERELDSDWQPIPAGFDGLTLLRLQAKSTTAQDDPVFRRCALLVR